LAADLEKAAKAKDFEFIRRHNPPFLEAAWRLVSELDGLLSSIESNELKPKKDKPDRDILLKLHAACNAFDMGEVDVLMAEINSYQYESDDGLADWLRNNVELVNFDEIVQRLSSLI
jgi:hypothetical protein